VLIICLSVAILGGGGFAAYWFVLKPKMLAKKSVNAEIDEIPDASEPDYEETNEDIE
jgi:hypothetical protein